MKITMKGKAIIIDTSGSSCSFVEGLLPVVEAFTTGIIVNSFAQLEIDRHAQVTIMNEDISFTFTNNQVWYSQKVLKDILGICYGIWLGV